ncbi:hypothetical protein D9757_010730 [Collybiopsis confluens]|uniref:Uncharacterized protein n=1 Tax=Collybiopsis confluens TaxID=2823264 RepID=A0A8H5GZG3_9AGAR|nr:hypothetical protein D9757_010730 [Collybiopsis confluens]
MLRLPIALAALSAVISVACAQLTVLFPGGENQWWVDGSDNLLEWNCNESQVQTFSVLINNPDFLTPLAIIADQPNFVCSRLITANQTRALPVGTGYTIELVNVLNSSDVYAQSAPFEIKPVGSAFPT